MSTNNNPKSEEFLDLSDLRQKIDALDEIILSTLAQRQNIVRKVGDYKRARGINIHQPQRWQDILTKLKSRSQELNLDPDIIEKIWTLIHLNSLRIER